MYRHVDILNQNGFEAYILHSKKGFRANWFENDTPIVYFDEINLDRNSYLSIPESFAFFANYSGLSRAFKKLFSKNKHKYIVRDLADSPAKKVIFNQGCYLTFSHYPIKEHAYSFLYRKHDVLGAIVVSEDSWNYLSFAFPGLKIYRTHNSLDSTLFTYSKEKKKQIALITGKTKEDIRQVLNILRSRNSLQDFELVYIENKSEKEVAQILKESLIFLSFGTAEGCPVPPQEAMRSGCIVIGYHGRGGKEYYKEEFCYPVETGNITGFVEKIEEVINLSKSDPHLLEIKRKKASEYIEKNYSREREIEDVINIWNDLLQK